MRTLLLVVLCASIYTVLSAKAVKNPVVFVPGSFCSQIEVRINTTIQTKCPKSLHNKWTTLWINIEFFEPTRMNCFQDVIQMKFNQNTNEFENAPGVETRIKEFGNFSGLIPGWMYSSFSKFQSAFEDNGYVSGLNLHAAPYDFRRAVINTPEFLVGLKSLVETTYTKNNNQKIYLIGHSTGPSMILYFLTTYVTQAWKDMYIQGLISLSGNYAGEIDNADDIISGMSLVPVIASLPKTVTQTFDFYAWRLPNPKVFGSKDFIFTPKRNYSAFDIHDLFTDIGAAGLASVYSNYSTLLYNLTAPNVNTHCFYGENVKTPIGYEYHDFNSKASKTFEGPGDGEQDDTANHSCRLWNTTMDPRFSFAMAGFNGVGHVDLPGDKHVLQAVLAVVLQK